jgi:2-C-methyl-D-erythritol 4-phosphate cytidylyltransferase
LAKAAALIPCAGQGKRMRSDVNKPYLEINGRPLLCYTLDILEKEARIGTMALVCRAAEVEYCQTEIVKKYGFRKVGAVVAGGPERQDSVWCGLKALPEDVEWVVVHDGVRPLLSPATLTRALDTAFSKGSAVVGVPAKDTIKKAGADLTVQETLDRRNLWLIQTPQVFRRDVLWRAHQQAAQDNWQGTDDASLVERLGIPVQIVAGEYSNIKVTTPEDLVYVQEMLRTDKL